MAIDSYSTNDLLGVVNKIQPLNTYWLDLCFPSERLFETETIDLDELDNTRHLAPFVSPLVQGPSIAPRGYTTRQLKPAYIKLEAPISPNRGIKRRPGEAYTGSLSIQQRFDAAVMDMMTQFETRLTRRMEWMAAQVVQNGSVTIESDFYPTSVVNFNRASGLTVTLGAGARWNESTGVPLENLETWGNLMLAEGAGGTYRVTMGTSAWKAFYANAQVKEELDVNVRGTTGILSNAPAVYDGAVYRGRIGVFEIWTYNDWYHNDAGTVTNFMDPRDVVITSTAVNGTRCFGAILDVESLHAARVFPKSWIEKNPSALMLLLQSSPLLVPGNQNATFRARVLA